MPNSVNTGHSVVRSVHSSVNTGHSVVRSVHSSMNTGHNVVRSVHSSVNTGRSHVRYGHSSVNTGHSVVRSVHVPHTPATHGGEGSACHRLGYPATSSSGAHPLAFYLLLIRALRD